MDLIRGKQIDQAVNILQFTQKKAAEIVEKAIRSAAANLLNRDETVHIDVEDVFIKEIYVDGGTISKRFRAASMGRGVKIRKRTSHLTIVVAEQE